MPPLSFGADAAPASPDQARAILLYHEVLNLQLVGGTIMTIVAIGTSLLGIKARRETQKREITFGTEYLTKQEASLSADAVTARFEAIEQTLRDLRAEMIRENSSSGTASDQRMARLQARLEAVETNLQSQITDMPAKLIALLRNAGVIK